MNFVSKDENGNQIDFLWGASTSSYQVEGNINNSDWSKFTSSDAIKRRVKEHGDIAQVSLNLESPGRAVDHRIPNVFLEDIQRVKLLGMNCYRLSLEWSKIQPRKPAWAESYINARLAFQPYSHLSTNGYDPEEFSIEGLNQYLKMLQVIKANDLKVILTLNHMSLPDWVLTPPTTPPPVALGIDSGFCHSLRGWENSLVVEAFGNFVQHIVNQFKDFVEYWITINEPIATVMQCGYIAGIFPPGFSVGSSLGNDSNVAKSVYFNLIHAHVHAYDIIKKIAGAKTKVGFSHAVIYPNVAAQSSLERQFIGDNEIAKKQWHYAINQYFLDAVTKGDYNQSLLFNGVITHKRDWANKLDFVAPQYYRSANIYHDIVVNATVPWIRGNFKIDLRKQENNENKELYNDLGWSIFPQGFYLLLKEFHNKYKLPILITENGICEAEDRNRSAYIVAHLDAVLAAVKDGVNILGYIHWSIIDNYEWAFGYQKEARFGLFTIDRNARLGNNQLSCPRHITEGALCLQYIIANSKRISKENSNEDPLLKPKQKFGTINDEGSSVQPPSVNFGCIWIVTKKDSNNPFFNLYLNCLSKDKWIGMIFLFDISKWIAIENIQWKPLSVAFLRPFKNGILTFQHKSLKNPKVFCEYEFDTHNSSEKYHLKGKMKSINEVTELSGTKENNMGTWKSNSISPTYITLHRLEGDYDKLHVKYLNNKPQWVTSPLKISEISHSQRDAGNDLLDVKIGVPQIVAGMDISIDWHGKKLTDDIPF